LSPQQWTVPRADGAQAEAPPTLMATASEMPWTRVGVSTADEALSPELQIPQQRTVPSSISANVWKPPAPIATTPVSPGTADGVVDPSSEPLPMAASSSPQH
jgi:hypothetical protein